ncbi:MAG: hypothetical protein RTU92_10480 [Candidatus Thorarchaeota archaeon]
MILFRSIFGISHSDYSLLLVRAIAIIDDVNGIRTARGRMMNNRGTWGLVP